MIKDVRIGDTQALRMYCGDTIVWERTTARLPPEYQEVEYIESTGTQYIDTLVPMSTTFSFSATGIWTGAKKTDGCFLGARLSTYNGGVFWWNTYNISDERCLFSWRYGASGYDGGNYFFYNAKIQVCTYGKDLYINGEKVGTSIITGDTSCTLNILLFALNNNNKVDSRKWRGELYDCKLYDDGAIVRDFVPCYRKSDDEVGMYDLVSQQFFPNQGTGAFISGPDIN